jgi:hypothetical protein
LQSASSSVHQAIARGAKDIISIPQETYNTRCTSVGKDKRKQQNQRIVNSISM